MILPHFNLHFCNIFTYLFLLLISTPIIFSFLTQFGMYEYSPLAGYVIIYAYVNRMKNHRAIYFQQ